MALVSDSVKVKHVPAMISWSRCHELMCELQNDAVDNIDYAIALSAIMEDMHMVAIPHSVTMNESEFVSFVFNYFPTNSIAMEWAKTFIGLKYMLKDKNEYIACFDRDEFNRLTTKGTKVDFTGNSPEYLQRAVVEFNENYVQLIGCSIPVVEFKGNIFFIFVKEESSDMKGHTTFIGGHIQYAADGTPVSEIFDRTSIREANEELLTSGIRLMKEEESIFDFNDTHSVESTSISHYHYGRARLVLLPSNDILNNKIEEGKTLVAWSPTINTEDSGICQVYHVSPVVDNPDSWVITFMNVMSHKK